MAATNIDNLDALDSVAEIDADEEEILKAAVKGAIVIAGSPDGYRLTDLFIGQMSAEGFDLSAGDGTGIRAYVQSPTVKVEHVIRDGRKPEVVYYFHDGSDFVQAGRGVFPVFLHPDYPPRT